MHRKMMFRSKYGRIGLFALPYQLLFEAMAPIFECLGYIVVPLSWAAGILSTHAFLAFMAFAMAFNLLLSAASLLVSVTAHRADNTTRAEALLEYRDPKSLVILFVAGLLSNLGYRQYILAWQLKGLKDYFAGHKGWDKFARQGFAQESQSS